MKLLIISAICFYIDSTSTFTLPIQLNLTSYPRHQVKIAPNVGGVTLRLYSIKSSTLQNSIRVSYPHEAEAHITPFLNTLLSNQGLLPHDSSPTQFIKFYTIKIQELFTLFVSPTFNKSRNLVNYLIRILFPGQVKQKIQPVYHDKTALCFQFKYMSLLCASRTDNLITV